MAKNFSGREFKMYAGTSAPLDATAAADAAYELVGNATAHSVTRSRNALDISTKDDGDNSAFIGMRRNESVQFSGLFDHTEDAGYTKLSDAYESESGTVYLLLTSTTTGDTEWHGSGVITDLSLDFSDESASTFTATIQISGALTEVTGTST